MSEYKLPTNELLKLIELSQKATPGKFQWVTEPGKHAIIAALQDNAPVIGVAIVNEKLNDKNGKQKKADAAFIVTACNAAADMARELMELREKADQTCEWKQDEESLWETSCGESFYFEDGGLKENHCTYCHHCGKKIVEIAYKSDDEETEASNE